MRKTGGQNTKKILMLKNGEKNHFTNTILLTKIKKINKDTRNEIQKYLEYYHVKDKNVIMINMKKKLENVIKKVTGMVVSENIV